MSNKVPKEQSATSGAIEDDQRIALWCLRALIHFKGPNTFIDNMGGFHNEQLLQTIGLLEYYGQTQIDHQEASRILKSRLEALEDRVPPQSDIFSRNICHLKKALLLSDSEIEILRFTVASNSSSAFAYILDTLGEISIEQTKIALSVMLAMPLYEIEQALRAEGTLLSSGILHIETSTGYLIPLRGRMDVPHGIKAALSQEHSDASAILQCFFRHSIEAQLAVEDFPHITTDVGLIQGYLQSVAEIGTSGVNILIHGDPGTGKTELVRALAAACNLHLYEITMQDMNGAPIDGKDRFSAYQLSQKLLAHKERCAILFDEIEDVFPDTSYMLLGPTRMVEPKKAWVNTLLEENKVPAFWVSNTVHHIHPSFLRRFDYTLKLRPPTRAVRRRILERYLGHLSVRDEWMSHMVEHEHLAPAHIERAAKVVSHLKHSKSEEIEQTLERIIGNRFEVMGLPRKPRIKAAQATRYSLEFLNPDNDLTNLTKGLKLRPTGRLCLYGAPGTGKTAFAYYLAEQLDKALLVRRASDILSKWVGESEQNIAAMFQEAEAEDMILLLDEADSFLRERSNSNYSWETTQVNELLVQMELFDGVFIASTNLMDSLDSASLRRFDLKVRFDFMKPCQAWALFKQVMEEHDQKLQDTAAQTKARIYQLDNLTPGDFATVIRQTRSMNQTMNAELILHSLERECRAKSGGRRPIGFSAN